MKSFISIFFCLLIPFVFYICIPSDYVLSNDYPVSDENSVKYCDRIIPKGVRIVYESSKKEYSAQMKVSTGEWRFIWDRGLNGVKYYDYHFFATDVFKDSCKAKEFAFDAMKYFKENKRLENGFKPI
jgi:hypothetical protein